MNNNFLLLQHIRTYIYVFSLLLSLLVVLVVFTNIPDSPSRYITLSKSYADVAAIYLYFTLLISPVTTIFKKYSWASVVLKARKSIGISVCLFAFLHALVSFFKQFGGIHGLSFLSNRYLFAFAIGACSLTILILLTVTSATKVRLILGNKLWKIIHRSIYLLGALVLVHAVLLSSKFANFNQLSAWTLFICISILLLLELRRFDKWMKGYCTKWYPFPFGLLAGIALIVLSAIYMYRNPINPFSLSTHSTHEVEVKTMQGSNH